MKKVVKKSVAVILALCICLCVCMTAVADTGSVKRTCPQIHVHGFMASEIYVDKDDPDSGLAWPPSTDAILDTVKKALPAIAKFAVTKNYDKFGEELAVAAKDLFSDICSDYNGEVTNGSGLRFEYPEKDEVKKDSHFTFSYDWREDPIKIAKQLNDYINYITKCAGTKQVTIHCHSLGGVMTLSYLKLYGDSKVKSVVFDSTAIYGETYTGELMTGKLALSTDSLVNFMDFTFDQTDSEFLMDAIMDILAQAGLLDVVCEFAEGLVAEIFDEIDMILLRLFANWPTIWAMVPDEDLEEAKEYVFSIYDEEGIDYSALEKKIDNYTKKVRNSKTATLKSIAKTTNVYVISRYGYSSIPVTPSWNVLGDGVIDTANSSFGARTASFGTTLKTNGVDSAYISPDKTVDASTCLFPEQTWFVKGLKHPDWPDCLDGLIDNLLYYKGKATVDTFEQYPRFLRYDAENSALLADAPLTAIETLSNGLLEILKAVFFSLF